MEEYPRDLAELEAKFGTEEECRAYLASSTSTWPVSKSRPGRTIARGRALLECAGCGCQTSVTAGTIFQDTRGKLFFRLAQQAMAAEPITYDRIVHPVQARAKAKLQSVGVT